MFSSLRPSLRSSYCSSLFPRTYDLRFDVGADTCQIVGARFEYKLEHTKCHEEYKEILGAELEDFLQSKGYSPQEFFDIVADDPIDGETIAVILNSAASFDNFVSLMIDAKEKGTKPRLLSSHRAINSHFLTYSSAGTWAGTSCITYS